VHVFSALVDFLADKEGIGSAGVFGHAPQYSLFLVSIPPRLLCNCVAPVLTYAPHDLG
jgi:hypothetical protein